MQGSFWKTVAVVGVIGIGSLAILEVQNRLPRQNGSAVTEEVDTLAQQIAETGDKSVEALLTTSDFDQMLVSADSGAQQFDMSEPPQHEPALKPTPMAETDQRFHDSEPIALRQITPPVNTSVRAEQLVQGENPFAEQGAVTAVAANYQRQPEPVEPVGFVQAESFAGNNSPAQAEPFRRDNMAPAADPDANEPFSLFVEEAASDNQTPAQSQPPALEVPNLQPQAQNRPGAIKFFNGSGQTDGVDGAAADEKSVSAAASPFYESDTAPLRPTPAAEQPVPSDNTPMFDRDSDPAPTLETPDINFPSLPDRTAPASNQPQPQDDGFSPPGGLFTEDANDLVPSPREPSVTPPNFSSDFDSFDAEPNRPINQPQPRPEPVRSSPEPDSSLPFAEDVDSGPSPRTLDVPVLEEPGRLSIPDTSPSFPDTPIRESDPGFRMDAPSRLDSPDIRPFPSNPLTTPGLNVPEPSRPISNGPREFNGGTREFESNGSRDFDSDMNISPRSPNDETREFNGSTDVRDPGIRNNGNSGVRSVSGVMRPNLVLQKDAPQNATVGAPLDYTISVSNEGDATAFEVIVEDEMPAGASVDGANPQPELDRINKRMVWKFAEILPNETKKITVRVTPTGEGTLDGVASVKFKSRVKATTVITAPKLRLEMVGPDEVKLGEEVSYRYVITNEGSGEARDVFVRTVLPASGGLKHPQGRDLEYEIGNMTPGQQRELVLAVVAAEPGEYKTEAEVSATGGAKDQAAYRTNIIGAQLQIVRRGPKRRFVGRSATYENIVSNETNFDAVDARIVETVPLGMRFMGASSGGQFDAASRTVTWRINRLGPGQQEQLQIELMPEDAGARESIVKIFENAGLQSDDYVSTTVVEDLHNVGAKMSRLDQPMAVGETFGFTITIDNRGTADATDVKLIVEVPPEIKVVGAGSKDNQAKLLAGNVVQYSVIVRISPNEQQSFEVKMEGAEPVRNGVVKAKVSYKQMEEALVVSESVTIYREEP